MKIQSRPQLDVAQEAQLAFVNLLKYAHRMSKDACGNGIVQLSFRATHSEIETIAIFEDGSRMNKTEALDALTFIPRNP